MRKKLAAVGLTAGLAGGAVAGFAFTANSGIVGAQDGTTTTTVAPGQAPTDAPADGQRPDRSAHLQEALKGLVDDGTITQEQADKVVEALLAAGPKGGMGGPGGPGGGFGKGHGGPGLEAAATALGLTEDELRTELQAGKTIADVAKDKGVELSVVVDALVAEATDRINQQVTDGKITQAEADEKLSTIEERITARLNGEMPDGAPGFGGPGGGFGGPGHRGPGDGAPGDAPGAPTTTVPTDG